MFRLKKVNFFDSCIITLQGVPVLGTDLIGEWVDG
jgi:hypothetical protein